MGAHRLPAENSATTLGGRWEWVVGAVIFSAAVLPYLGATSAPFFFDDHPAIVDNESIRSLWPIGNVLSPPTTGAGVVGRPIINLSLALNYAIGGLDPRGYHLTNFLIHGLAGLTLWGVLRRTLRTLQARAAAETIAAFAALLWVAHPLQTESVTCVIQRSESLAALIYLLAFYSFIRATEAKPARGWAVLCVGACVLGVAAKEILATAPLLFLLYDRAFGAGTFRESWTRHKKLYAALTATWLMLAYSMAGSAQRGGTVGFGLGMSSYDYLLTQCQALTIYLKLSLWPHPLVVDYGFPVVTSLGAVWLQGLLIVALLGATVFALVRAPRLGFLGAWFFIILAPSSSFVPLTTQTIAEHRMYLPLVAITTLIGVLLDRTGRIGRWALPTALCLGYVATTIVRNQDYRSEFAIWSDTLAKAPTNPRAHYSIGYLLNREGRTAEAMGYYEAALTLKPDYADARNNYANLLQRAGRVPEAIPHYEVALELKPESLDARYNLGVALTHTHQPEKAVATYTELLRRAPGRQDARRNLGGALLEANRPQEALACYEQVLAATPQSAEAHQNVAAALVMLNRLEDALGHYAQAVELAPGNGPLRVLYGRMLSRAGRMEEATAQFQAAIPLQPEMPELYFTLGKLLFQTGRVPAAIDAYLAALKLRPESAEFHHHLAVAYARIGRMEDAEKSLETALRLQPGDPDIERNLAQVRAQLRR